MPARSEARAAARAGGKPRYVGKLCLKHVELGGERKTSDGSCTGCHRDGGRKLYAANIEKERARTRTRMRKKYAEEPEWARERNRKKREATAAKPKKPQPRKEAKASGAPRFLGNLCKKHPEFGGERLTATSTCIECSRERQRRQRTGNTQYLARRRQQHAENPEKMRELKRKWYAANPAKAVAHTNIRRARKKGADVPLTPAERQQIEALYALARERTAQTGFPWAVDHIVALANGGTSHPSNLQVLPAAMNASKGAKEIFDYLAFLVS